MDTKSVFMDSKKSLGHFPVGYSSQGESDYSFIPDLIGDETSDVKTAESSSSDEVDNFRPVRAVDEHPQNTESENTEYVQVGSVKVKKSLHTSLFEEISDDVSILEREVLSVSAKPPENTRKKESLPHKKKVVSYYLEEILIEQVKTYADTVSESYSAIAASAIREYLEKRMDDES